MRLKFCVDERNFNLKDILECGQCFRWSNVGSSFYGSALERELRVCQTLNKDGKPSILTINILNQNLKLNRREEIKIWENYFDLKTNYDYIKENLKNISPVLFNAIKMGYGIRILRQDPWEVLCSFIISQNNNIPRIKIIIENLCKTFGTKIGNYYYNFPSYKILANLSKTDLIPIKAGFRSEYILDAAKKVENNSINFEELSAVSSEKGQILLRTIKGVGQKVAACTLLFGFHKLDVFPIDIWIKRCMEEDFPKNNYKDFGPYAGVAQQYLFFYKREMSKILKK